MLIFNRSGAMVMPQGISKATGQAALRMLRLSPRNTVAVGDAENDHDLLGGGYHTPYDSTRRWCKRYHSAAGM